MTLPARCQHHTDEAAGSSARAEVAASPLLSVAPLLVWREIMAYKQKKKNAYVYFIDNDNIMIIYYQYIFPLVKIIINVYFACK